MLVDDHALELVVALARARERDDGARDAVEREHSQRRNESVDFWREIGSCSTTSKRHVAPGWRTGERSGASTVQTLSATPMSSWFRSAPVFATEMCQRHSLSAPSTAAPVAAGGVGGSGGAGAEEEPLCACCAVAFAASWSPCSRATAKPRS